MMLLSTKVLLWCYYPPEFFSNSIIHQIFRIKLLSNIFLWQCYFLLVLSGDAYTARELMLASASKFWAGQVESWPGWVEFHIELIWDILFLGECSRNLVSLTVISTIFLGCHLKQIFFSDVFIHQISRMRLLSPDFCNGAIIHHIFLMIFFIHQIYVAIVFFYEMCQVLPYAPITL